MHSIVVRSSFIPTAKCPNFPPWGSLVRSNTQMRLVVVGRAAMKRVRSQGRKRRTFKTPTCGRSGEFGDQNPGTFDSLFINYHQTSYRKLTTISENHQNRPDKCQICNSMTYFCCI